MFAIIESGGKQYRVQPNDVIEVEKIKANPGENIKIDKVLAVSNNEGLTIGTPVVEGANVEAEVIEHGKGDKIIIYKYKPKKKYRRKQGHRQPYTLIKINDIVLEQPETSEEDEISVDENAQISVEPVEETIEETSVKAEPDTVEAESVEFEAE